MFTRIQRAQILESCENKEERILVSNILDKAFRFEKENKLVCTNFLNLHELDVARRVLNKINIDFDVYTTNENSNKKVIFFMPNYIDDYKKIYSDYISCIKITPNIKKKLIHKDYMGSIYSLGIKNEMIGDIFAYEDCAYMFCMKTILDFIFTNLYKVGNQDVKIEEVSLDSNELLNISVNLVKKEYIIPSLRIDAVLSEVYNISRSETKEKIIKGDLYINDRNIFFPHVQINEDDIVSFKKCGKLKIGNLIRKTKSNSLVINIYKFL